MTQKIGSVPQWYLGADCLATDTTLYPRSIVGWSGEDLTAAEVGDSLYAVLMNKDKNKMELIQIDPATLATYNTTGLDIMKRGLPFFVDGSATDEIEVSDNKLNWSVGDILLVGSNPPYLYRLGMKFLNGGEFPGDYDLTGQITFSSLKYPKLDNVGIDPVNDEDLVTKKYVVDVAAGVGVSYNRIVVAGNAGEDIAAGELVYFDETDKEWKLADASVAGTSEQVKLGIAQGAGADGTPITGGVLVDGMDANQTGLVAGDLMYLSDTAGAISDTAGTVSVEVGYAHDATRLLFAPRLKKFLTTDQQAALAGSAGTPSSTNKFITADDVDEANTASKIPRRDVNGDVIVADTPTTPSGAINETYFNNNKVETAKLAGNDNGAAWFTMTLPWVGNQANSTIGWKTSSTTEWILGLASPTANGIAGYQIFSQTSGGASITTRFGFGKGTQTDFILKFVAGSFIVGDTSGYVVVGVTAETTLPFLIPVGTYHAHSALFTVEKIVSTNTLFAVSKGATLETKTQITTDVTTPALFEIIHTAGVSTVFKRNGVVVATHDDPDRIPHSTTAVLGHSGNRGASGSTGAGFSAFVTSIKL
jgi:hypothetical protein